MLAGLPLVERRLDVAGAPTAVLEGGAGPQLVLLHGGIECGGAYWAPVVPTLAAALRLVVPDVPGLGASAPVDRLDATSFTDWLAGLIEQTCADPPDLVAHSLIGSLAARAAAARPRLLRSLMVYAAPGIGPYRMPLGLRAVAIRFAMRPTERNHERFERWAFVDRDAVRARDPAWFDAFAAYSLERARLRHVKRAMAQLVRAGTARIATHDLGNIAVPTTLLWGRDDRFVPIRVAQVTAGALDWPLAVVDGAGHVPHIERPEAFASALREALGRRR